MLAKTTLLRPKTTKSAVKASGSVQLLSLKSIRALQASGQGPSSFILQYAYVQGSLNSASCLANTYGPGSSHIHAVYAVLHTADLPSRYSGEAGSI